MSQPFTYERQSRDKRTALLIIAIWTALVMGWVFLDMAAWIVFLLAAFTLPAMWDHYANPLSGLTLDDERITWFSGKRGGEVALSEIDHVRLDTRLDLSVRVTLVTRTGTRIRLPYEATPPHESFENELNQRGLKTRRAHFQLFQ
ncbi:hypothetical protein AB2B41_05765 [Marimonas sp. MJW-29]|uniref:PH domain-containing protein n=1 Tax=Sulfitobacter sediminis TaxID=3234186 RepID=A0ABV3RKL4_9RHOB